MSHIQENNPFKLKSAFLIVLSLNYVQLLHYELKIMQWVVFDIIPTVAEVEKTKNDKKNKKQCEKTKQRNTTKKRKTR